MTIVLSHRGLDPSIPNFPIESCAEAFRNHLQRGLGLEFDITFLSDQSIAVFHDSDLTRISKGKDNRKLSEISSNDFAQFNCEGASFLLLTDLFNIISDTSAPLHALHFKGKLQSDKNISNLANILNSFPEIFKKILVFDLYPNSAALLSKFCPGLNLACSLSREFDIKRYNQFVDNTLLSFDQFVENKDLFSWVWMDEWDVSSPQGIRDEFYSAEIFSKIRKYGTKIALVTPELHASSPGLLGAESHQDGNSPEILRDRITRILSLSPDAVCTDFPDIVTELIKHAS